MTKEQITQIAIKHQKSMNSTHPHAIIGAIEDAILEAFEKCNVTIDVVSVCHNCGKVLVEEDYAESYCVWCGRNLDKL